MRAVIFNFNVIIINTYRSADIPRYRCFFFYILRQTCRKPEATSAIVSHVFFLLDRPFLMALYASVACPVLILMLSLAKEGIVRRKFFCYLINLSIGKRKYIHFFLQGCFLTAFRKVNQLCAVTKGVAGPFSGWGGE